MIALRVTLALALWFALTEGMHGCGGERTHHLSVLGLLVPRLCEMPRIAFALAQVAFAASAVLWALRRYVPWTSWAAVALFVLVESARQETSYLSDHEAYTVTMVLVLFAAWFTFDRARIRAGDLAMPRWLPLLAAAYLGWTYTMSGIVKLSASGLAWADGTSMRLWLANTGGDATALGALLSRSPGMSRALMTATLAVETLALPLALWRPAAIVLGVTMIVMHAASTWLFGVGFFGNIALCAIFLVWIPYSGTSWLGATVPERSTSKNAP